MILIQEYTLSVFFFILAMICWGSWANSLKIAPSTWSFELFYWDFTVGLIFSALIFALTLGSFGPHGRSFTNDLVHISRTSIFFALLSGFIWNAGTLLLSAAIRIAGMATAFPIGGGIAWILGIAVNYFIVLLDKGHPESNPLLLWGGTIFIIIAIVLTGKAYKDISEKTDKPANKGILLSVVAGLLIAFFYGFLVKSLDGKYVTGGSGTMTPYTAIFIFTLGALLSTLIIIPVMMKKPVEGMPVPKGSYFSAKFSTHLIGLSGSFVFVSGLVASLIAIGPASPAIAYALSNAAPVVAMLWGIFLWKEFHRASKNTRIIVVLIFIFYLIGLGLITASNAKRIEHDGTKTSQTAVINFSNHGVNRGWKIL